MKFLLRILVLFMAFSPIFFDSSCTKERWFSKIIYQGYVYDTIGGAPKPAVWVSLYACSGGSADNPSNCSGSQFKVGQGMTDPAGHFYIHDNAARSDHYYVFYGTSKGTFGVDILGTSGDGLKSKEYANLYYKK